MSRIFFILLASPIISSCGNGSNTDNTSNTKSDTFIKMQTTTYIALLKFKGA